MAIVVFLRGANVGGHRRFRPLLLAKDLEPYDVVSVGATGLFVVRNPGPMQTFRSELLARLPFDAQLAICDARDLLALGNEEPFTGHAATCDVVRFVSVLVGPVRGRLPAMPLGIPSNGEWYVRMLGHRKQVKRTSVTARWRSRGTYLNRESERRA